MKRLKTSLVCMILLCFAFNTHAHTSANKKTYTHHKHYVQQKHKNRNIKHKKSTRLALYDPIECLATNIYHEARGESIIGQKAVAFVTMNRAKSGKYPSNVCNVVFQKGQFSWVHQKGSRAKVVNGGHLYQIASEIYHNHDKLSDPSNGAIYFHRAGKGSRKKGKVIGNHVFYG